MEQWLNSKRIKEILQITSQCLYAMRLAGRIEYKRVSDRKYLYKLPESFVQDKAPSIAIYARVSTTKQKKDLDNQLEFLRSYAVSTGNKVDNNLVFSDIASGMNENRRGLNALINEIISGRISKVIISNRDRLTRFGFGYLKSLFEKFDCEIVEVNLSDEKTFEQELTDDLISMIHHFSMKFCGKRKNKLSKMEKELKNDK